jgi:hypothetical protein
MSGFAEGPQHFGVHWYSLGETKNREMKTKALTGGVTSGATHRGNQAASGGAGGTHL